MLINNQIYSFRSNTNYITATEGEEKLAAGFIASPKRGKIPLAVNFTDRSTGNIASWSWDFDGDGNADSQEQHPVYTYKKRGAYTVSLIVTESGGLEEKRKVKVDYITVTKKACPAALALKGKTGELKVIRSFRDKILTKSVAGREYIELYRKYAPEISSLIIDNKGIFMNTAGILQKYSPRLQSLAEGNKISLYRKERQEIISLLDRFKQKAGPELQNVIEKIKDDFNDGRKMDEVGIIVE